MSIFKKSFFVALAALSVFNINAEVSSKSFFSMPSLFRPSSPEMTAANRQQLVFDERDPRSGVSVTAFGGQSINNDQLAKYFLPHAGKGVKSTIVAGEFGSDAATKGTLDVLANYFGVRTNAFPTSGDAFDKTQYKFQSSLTFKPKHKFYGATIAYHQHLSKYTDKGYWFEAVMPVVYVKNTLGMTEEVTTAGGTVPSGFFGNMTDAFKQSDWNYGKIDGERSKIGVGDIQLKVGNVYAKEKHYYLNSYVGISIPAASKPTAEYVFEPNLGSNGHFGFISGGLASIRVWAKCEKTLHWICETAGTFLFDTSHMRSFDLLGRPWSRYMYVYLDDVALATTGATKKLNPGINSFTLPAQVSAGSVRDLTTAFVYKQNGFHAEWGYHFYGRHAEELGLEGSLGNSIAIAGIVDDAGDYNSEGGISRNHATINRYLEVKNDTKSDGSADGYKALTDGDLDLESAAHPAVISHTFYGSLGYHTQDTAHPLFMGIGASAELGSDNAGIDKVMLWGKLELSF